MEDYKAIIAMILCQSIYSGVTLSVRAALIQEMSSRVFIVYRQAIAFLLIAPIYAYRKGTRACSLGWNNFLWISLLSFLGVTLFQNMYFEGLGLASSSAASALGNLAPAITFVMAYLIGLEKIHVRSLRSWGKIIGTLVCVGGAVSIALLKGPKLLNNNINNTNNNNNNTITMEWREDSIFSNKWLIGCMYLFGSPCCWSLWLIFQVHVTGMYPDHLSITTWTCLIATVQCGILALMFEQSIDSWKLNSALQLFSCFYAGLASAVTVFAQTWCISRRGPVFSASFSPLSTVITTVVASTFMHEDLYTGSLIGAMGVIMGLYIVLWGKAKDYEDHQLKCENDTTISINIEEPLLLEKKENIS